MRSGRPAERVPLIEPVAAVQRSNQSIASGVKVGKVEDVEEAYARFDGETFLNVTDPAELHVRALEPTHIHLSGGNPRDPLGHAAEQSLAVSYRNGLQLSQRNIAIVDKQLTCWCRIACNRGVVGVDRIRQAAGLEGTTESTDVVGRIVARTTDRTATAADRPRQGIAVRSVTVIIVW